MKLIFVHLFMFQDNGPSVAFALAGGLVLSVGNLACQYAWPFVGLSATEVISASITVVIGIIFHFFKTMTLLFFFSSNLLNHCKALTSVFTSVSSLKFCPSESTEFESQGGQEANGTCKFTGPLVS